MNIDGNRIFWIDYAKVFACILVLTGHLFQSLVKAEILPQSNMYEWFNTTIYYFHVPLFFICSGYLYQYKKRMSDSSSSRLLFVLWKFVILGIPYFSFTIFTWILKKVFVGTVNDEAGSLLHSLFIQPISPYWFLYILFFVFIITPTIKDKKQIIVFIGMGLILKFFLIIGSKYPIMDYYIIFKVCFYEIFFVIGMVLAIANIKVSYARFWGAFVGLIFLLISVHTYKDPNDLLEFVMGILGCMSVLMIVIDCKEYTALTLLAQYTMPIFLMHTLVAAPTRIVLRKLGINNGQIHIFAGITASIVGPIVLVKIMEKIKLDWLVFPNRVKTKC